MGSQESGQSAPRPGRYLLGGPIKRELKRITRRMGIYDRHRAQLLQKAQKGDVGALVELYERWRLRLPLVEGRIGVTLPWMGRGEDKETMDHRPSTTDHGLPTIVNRQSSFVGRGAA